MYRHTSSTHAHSVLDLQVALRSHQSLCLHTKDRIAVYFLKLILLFTLQNCFLYFSHSILFPKQRKKYRIWACIFLQNKISLADLWWHIITILKRWGSEEKTYTNLISRKLYNVHRATVNPDTFARFHVSSSGNTTVSRNFFSLWRKKFRLTIDNIFTFHHPPCFK